MSSVVKIFLPDQSVREFDHAPTALEVAQSIGSRLGKEALGALVNDNSEVLDIRTVLSDGDRLRILTSKDSESLEVIRHSAAHVLAQAVQEIWPEVKVTIGPVIEDGFYYDFDSPFTFSPEDLEKIEKKIAEIITRNEEVRKEVWLTDKAVQKFTEMGENFKAEIIRDLGAPEVSIYWQGSWFDLCRGPHVQRIGQVGAVKVLSLAGSYWRGDEKNKQLQRVYATAFHDKKALAEHLKNLEEAKRRDHRKLGKELGLFYFDALSPGGPFFAPPGAQIYNSLQSYIRELYVRYGYQEVITPQVFDVDLYHQSGHFENYRENMYFTKIDERDFSLKPMNCPGHCVLYTQERKSYRELPWRIADFGRLHRYERSGVMHGLTRVRTFCQDDAHIFCTVDQVQTEIRSFMELLKEVYQTLGMTEFKVFLSTRPEKRMGSEEVWDRAEGALEQALNDLDIPYRINPGDGAFYGPKLDIMFIDAMKRSWQLGTLQVDFNLPRAFNLSYVGEDNSEHQPVMLHRAVLGSLERFIGVYLEHTAGHLPLWLSPIQVAILNVSEKHLEYGRELEVRLKEMGLRVFNDTRNEKLGFKIRSAQMQKTPYMLIIGDNEVQDRKVSVRLRTGENVNSVNLDYFLTLLKDEVSTRHFGDSKLKDQIKSDKPGG